MKAEYHLEISKILKEYNDVLPKAAPKGPPSGRVCNVDIKVLREFKPKINPVYECLTKKKIKCDRK